MNDEKVLIRGLKAWEHMGFSTQLVKDHMKQAGVIKACEEISETHKTKPIVVKACQAVVDAVNRIKVNVQSTANLASGKPRVSIRQLFGDSRRNALDFPLEYKNMVLAGALFTKHAKLTSPSPRHVYVTEDLKWFVWREPKEKKKIDDSHKMKFIKIRSIESGRCTPALNRKKPFGGYHTKEECCFAVFGRDKSMSFETNTEAERERWVQALKALLEYHKALKLSKPQFVDTGS